MKRIWDIGKIEIEKIDGMRRKKWRRANINYKDLVYIDDVVDGDDDDSGPFTLTTAIYRNLFNEYSYYVHQ